MKAALEDLGKRLETLRARFADLGARAAAAAGGLRSTVAPPEALLGELDDARRAFADLRSAVLSEATILSPAPAPDSLVSLDQLGPVLRAIAEAEERRARRQAWEEAREEALVVLDRVMALIHREEGAFPSLEECQGKARELHTALSGFVPEDLEHETKILPGRIRPFTELMALVDGWNALDDDRCAFLQDAISKSFGRQLALAALRGKLGREGEALVTPEPRAARAPRGAPSVPYPEPVAPAPPVAPGYVPVAGASPSPGPVAPPAAPSGPAPAPPAGAPSPAAPAYPPVGAPGYAPAPAYSAGAAAAAPAGGVVVTGPGGAVVGGQAPGAPAGGYGATQHVVAAPGGPLVVEIRLSGEKVSVETPEERRQREELLERLANETARWWVNARSGWIRIHEGGMPFADAARELLGRFPYLLSVPIQKSADYEDGALAEGYALLLEQIERREEGFIREALTRLNPQFTTRAKDETYPLGQELYLYVVAEGRLYKTYPDFVREVLAHALPEPGFWVQGGLREEDGETVVFERAQEPPGTTEEQTRALTDDKARAGPHVFTVTTGPLTSRFFTLTAGDLADPRDVVITLKENDAPTDHAWFVTLPVAGATEVGAPRKHRVGGTNLPDLGRAWGGLWLALFNADPNNDKRYELAVTLKRKAPPPPAPGAKAPAAPAPKPSVFGRRR